MSNSVNSQQQSSIKPSVGATIGGAIAGGALSNAVKFSNQFTTPILMKKMQNLNNGLTADEFANVSQASKNLLKNIGLDKKGVEIIYATSDNVEEIAKIMTKEFEGNMFTRHLSENIKELLGNVYSNTVQKGQNAFYAMRSKKVVLPDDKLSLAAFHELGHATNANLSKFGKILQKCRPASILALPIALIALFKTKKSEGQEPQGAMDKATTFVKNNAGKLTFLAFVPTLLEEGLATIKGNGFAKKLLSSDLAKKVSRSNAFGFATYAGTAILGGLGICLGTKLKDKITDKNIEKQATLLKTTHQG